MTIIRFPDEASEKRGIEFLTGRFSSRSWPTGETIVPEAALAALTGKGIHFILEGPATYDRIVALRNGPATQMTDKQV